MKRRHIEDIRIETDETDHFSFMCSHCGVSMDVSDCYLKEEPKKCTWFILICPMCNGVGHRKVYWGSRKVSDIFTAMKQAGS